MSKSWAYGAGTVLAVHAAWFGLIYTRAEWLMAAITTMLFVILNAAGIGAFITAMTAPRRGFLLGLTLAPLSALLATLCNVLTTATGTQVDFSGFRSNFGLFAISTAYGLFVGVIGGAPWDCG